MLYADNEYHGPVQFSLTLTDTTNVAGDEASQTAELVLPAAAKTPVITIKPSDSTQSVSFRYKYQYILGAPDAEHDNAVLYRVPYSIGQTFNVSQAYPLAITHDGRDNRYAIDFAMPEGTAVHAARAGTVVAIAYQSFSGGTTAADAPKANHVRMLHDDGTLAVYAHLALKLGARAARRSGRKPDNTSPTRATPASAVVRICTSRWNAISGLRFSLCR